MIQTTKGIVLRSVKYGETSLVVTIFTELFGLQSYLVNGVRTASKKGSSKSAMFQPSAILELVAYHTPRVLRHYEVGVARGDLAEAGRIMLPELGEG